MRAIAERISLLTGASVSLEQDESAAWWKGYVAALDPATAPGDVTLRLGIRPRATRALAEGLLPVLGALDAQVTALSATPAVGSVLVRMNVSDGSAARLAEVQRIALDLAESATILSAPPEWKQGIDVWGAAPAGLEVMTEIREQFDPKRTLNPGRFAGFL